MIGNVEDVIKWLDLIGHKYFVVQSKDSDNSRIFEADESRTHEDNIAIFRRVMDVSSANRYIIKAGISKDSKRGNFLEEFKNTPNFQDAGNAQLPTAIQGIGEIEVNKRITDALDRYKTEVRLTELEKQNKEYEKELNRRQSVGEQFIERLTPYIGHVMPVIMAKFFPQPGTVALAGLERESETTNNNMNTNETTPVEEITLTEEQTDRAERALQKWASADPEFLEYIEAFAEFAASGKSVKTGFMTVSYAQVKEMFGPDKLREMLQ